MRADDKTDVHSKRGEERKEKQKVGIRKREKGKIIGEEEMVEKWNGGKYWDLGGSVCMEGTLSVAT